MNADSSVKCVFHISRFMGDNQRHWMTGKIGECDRTL